MTTATHRTIETVCRIESPRLIGGLVRLTRDVDLAEDLAQEAFLVALERWPETGVPDNPGAWLMATAKNRAIDHLRRAKMQTLKHDEVAQAQPASEALAQDELDDDVLGDDVLRLIFVACHPVVPREGRVALTLRLLGGLTTAEIARAFVVPEPTIAQRIVRAKRTLAEAGATYDVPRGQELIERLPSVLEVIYLIFNEGYAAASGNDWMRPELCREAMRLGRVLAARLPQHAEVHGLVALMELHASRMRARTDASGRPILLDAQSRAQWDHTLIQHGLVHLKHALALAQPLGPYAIQAAIAGCHARARTAEDTDWVRVVALYDALAQLTHSPIVELNRAVAISRAFGPEHALPLVDELTASGWLDSYHLLPTVRGDLLEKLGRLDEARDAFLQARALTKNLQEISVLDERIARLEESGPGALH